MCCLVNWERTRYACLYISTDCNKKNNTPLLTWCLLAEMGARFFDFKRIHSSGENVQRENAVIQPYHKLTNEVCNGEGGGGAVYFDPRLCSRRNTFVKGYTQQDEK